LLLADHAIFCNQLWTSAVVVVAVLAVVVVELPRGDVPVVRLVVGAAIFSGLDLLSVWHYGLESILCKGKEETDTFVLFLIFLVRRTFPSRVRAGDSAAGSRKSPPLY
jgi:hypothetical protein